PTSRPTGCASCWPWPTTRRAPCGTGSASGTQRRRATRSCAPSSPRVTPAYQSRHEVARAAGAQVTLVELEHESGWALDLDDVRRELRPDTRAIVVNFPHNPTGAH